MTGRSSRRSFISFSAVGAGLALLGRPAPSLAQAKTSKEKANYQSSPKGGQKCSECKFFIPENRCQRVEGEISPHGWCMFFTPKS